MSPIPYKTPPTIPPKEGSKLSPDPVRRKSKRPRKRLHTHPKERLQDPSIKDRATAKKYGIPVVVVGMGSQEIKAAMPDGSVAWWSFVWHGDASACRVKNAKR